VVVKARDSTKDVPRQLAALKVSDVAVVVSHSNIVPALWKTLGCGPDITLGDDEFDRLLVVIPRKGAAPLCLPMRME